MKFLSDILAKAGLTVDGVVTLNNTATGQTPATNDNSTKLATTAFIKNQSYLSANQTITVSGDATGSGTTSIALTLANSGVSAGTYGNASNIPTIVVDAKGRITSISTNAVSIVTTLAGLSDVTLTSPSANQVLQYNGTQWVNGAAPTTYSLPIATSSILGGIKIGSGLSIDAATGVVTVSGGGGGNVNFRTIQEFTSTSGQTTYTISGGYAVGYVEVLVNGVYISENQYTATNGTTIVLTDANSAGDIVTVFLYSLYNLGASVYARNVDTLTATAGQTTFSTSYIPGQIDVYYNGSKLTAAEYTATTGSSIVLSQAAVSGDIIEVVTYLAGAGLNSNRTLTINGTTFDLTANRTWTLTTANISEVTNLYYTDARARAAISVTGSGSYNSSTGVITVTGGVTSVNTLTGAVVLTTTNIAEGTNLYYTDARVGTYLTTNSYATQTYVGTQIANLVASSPATLDTLNELAAALGNDPSFATTVATSIGTKVPQTRTITINGTALDLSADRSFTIAGGVTSFNTRTGAITATSGDYTTALVTESGNLYYTDARARLALSGSTGISYNNTTGAISSTITQYTDTLARASISLSTTGTSGAATYDSATGVLNIPQYQGGVTSFNTRTGAITLSSLDVTTALTYTPVTNARTISINGTSYDLTADRSWTIAPDVSVRNTYAFTATAAQTTFTVTGGYSVGLVDVFINGVKLAAADFTATNGTTVVLGTGTGVGNIVEIVKYVSAFTTAVETTRTLTINGTTYDLSANRTWSIDNASLGAQAQLNGTGLVRMAGTTVSYDNATYATQSYVTTAVANLVNSAPSTLDTLNELATALGNDANFATTITTSIGTKQPQLNGTGFVKISGTTISYDNSTYLTTSSASSTYQTILTNPVTGTGTTNYLPKFTGASTIGNSNLINDASGNLGLGVTPSAWNSIYKAAEIGTAAIFGSSSYNSAAFSTNVFYNSANSPRYIASDFSNMYWQDDGMHIWYNAPSGTAGNAITFTQAMTLFANGNLAIGTTTDAGYKLDVNGTGRFSGTVYATTGVYTMPVFTPSSFGYSSSYNVVIFGNSSSAQTRSLAFNVDISANPSGAFSGNGSEYVWRNAGSFITPNSSNNGYNTLLSWNSSGQMTFTGAATFSSSITSTYGYFSSTGFGSFNSQITLNNTTSSPALITFQNTLNGHAFGFNSTTNPRFTFINGGLTEIAYITSAGAATFSGPTVTIGSAVAATNVKLLLNGVASKAAGIEFQQNGTAQWYIGNGIASEDNNFELYNSNGTMAMKIIKSTNAINFIGNVGIGGAPQGLLDVYKSTSGGLGGHIMLRNNGAAVGNEMAVMFVDGDAGTMRAAISSTTEGAPYNGDIKFKTGLGTYASLNTRMIIAGSTGYIGIGTLTPSQKLEVVGSSRISANSSYYVDHTIYGSNFNFGPGETTDNVDFKIAGGATWSTGGNFRWWTQTGSATPILRMRVTPNGSLHINRATFFGAGYGLVIGSDDGDLQCTAMMIKNNGNNCLNFFNASTTYVASISINASTVTYGTGSDYRLKEDLKDFNGLDKVSEIKVYDFKYKVEGDRMEGVLAHELQEVIPYAVTGYKDELDNQGNAKIQNVDYSKLVPVLVKAIQELKAEIDILKAR